MTIEPADELSDFPHDRDVGGNIERVGNQQQQDDALGTTGGNAVLILAASPLPVTLPICAHMAWTADING